MSRRPWGVLRRGGRRRVRPGEDAPPPVRGGCSGDRPAGFAGASAPGQTAARLNFLAHLHLAAPGGSATPAALVGSLMPDLVRGPLPPGLPPEVAAQVARHRRVDRATDTHPAFLEAAALFRPRLGRWAPVAADVCLDASLCRAWPGVHPVPLEEAVRGFHAGLFRGRGLMPPRMRAACRRMIAQGWLLRYASGPGLEATLRQMSDHFGRRLGRAVDLVPAAGVARERAAELDRLLVPLLAHLESPEVLGPAKQPAATA